MCLTDEDVLALLEGRLPPREAAAARAHTAECASCRQLVAAAARVREPSGRERPPFPSRSSATGEAVSGFAAEVTVPNALAPGASMGRYTILERIGSGGMGMVYAARDPELGRRVALKVISTTSRVGLPELRQRLLREAQAMAQVSHPNVTVVHEVGMVGSQVFLAMEFVEGPTLRKWLEAAPRGWREVLEAYFQAGRGLAAAHAQGLVHRDFKPDNVLMGADGRARVADFGLVRPGLDSQESLPDVLASPLTAVGALLGTPGYMAPEQLRGQVPDARADQFSFCVAVYEALYGVRPYGGDNLIARLQIIERGEVTRPVGRHQVPAAIGAVLRRGLLGEPGRRYPSMDALLGALERASRARAIGPAVPIAIGVAVALVIGAGLAISRSAIPGKTPAAGVAARGRGPETAGVAGASPAGAAPGGPGAAVRDRGSSAAPPSVSGAAAGEGAPPGVAVRDRGSSAAPSSTSGAAAGEAAPPDAAHPIISGAAHAGPPPSSRAALLARLSELESRGAPPPEYRALSQQCASAGEPAARARVLTSLSRLLHDEGDLLSAREAARGAAMAAQVAGDDDAAARAGFQLSAFMAASGLRPGEARRQGLFAVAAMERAGSPPELRALERQAHAEIALSAGRPEKAVEANAEAIATLRARPRPTDALLGQVLTDGGALLQRAGHGSEAAAQLREAVAVRSRVLRADHPLVAQSLLQLADVEAAQGDLAQARRDQARAVSILERGADRSSPRLLRARARLAELR